MSVDTEVLSKSVTKNDAEPNLFQMVVAPNHFHYSKKSMPDLGPDWSQRRDAVLRETIHWDKFWASAVRKAISLASSHAWEIRGIQADRIREAHELFHAANTVGYNRNKVAWGKGWDCYLSQHLRSYLLTGNGAFTEVVYNGARVVGFIHLDPSRCERTGDPNVPVTYLDTAGVTHELKYHQVFMLSDFADESTDALECGMCAADRAYDEIRIQAVTQQKYWERISGRNADTLHLISGMTNKHLKQIKASSENAADAKSHVYHMGNIISAIPGDADLKHLAIQLAGVSADYDREKDWKIAKSRYALALDIDVQDIAPLERGGLGSGGESRILDEKSRRSILFGWDKNWMDAANQFLLDTSTRFHFSESTNADDAKERAECLDTISTALTKLTGGQMVINPEQALQVAIDNGVLSSEFASEQETAGPMVLRRDDRSNLLHEPVGDVEEVDEVEEPEEIDNGFFAILKKLRSNF